MGLGLKLTSAFATVIIVMVLSAVIYSTAIDYLTTKASAQKRIDSAFSQINKELKLINSNNEAAASSIVHDQDFLSAYAKNSRSEVANELKTFIDKTGFPGFLTVIDNQSIVFYSTETPTKFGYSVKQNGFEVETLLSHAPSWQGAAAISAAGTISLTAMLPIPGTNGVITTNQPLSNEFLSGLSTQLALNADSDKTSDIDLALFSLKDNKVIAVTESLVGHDGEYISKINHEGLKAIPSHNFEAAGRLWTTYVLYQAPQQVLAVLLITTHAPSILTKLPLALGQIAVTAGLAFMVSLFFIGTISNNINNSLQFLIQRTRDLAAQKQTIAPLVSLKGDWLVLGELMDTAVASLRSSVQSLKLQVSKTSTTDAEKIRQVEEVSEQLDALNRQLSNQTKQSAEFSKQVNYANQQSVLLQQKLNSILQISTEGFLILDPYGNVLSSNPVFLNWVGVSEGEIAGQWCFDLIRKPGEPRSTAQNAQAFVKHSGNPADLINKFYPEGIIYHSYSDKYVEVLTHLQPVVTDESNIQGWIMVLRDKSLHSEIAQLRTEIVSILSDSIRAPLASIEPSWQAIFRNVAHTMQPSMGQSLAQIHSHYQQLLGLVDNLLMMYGGNIPPPAIPKEQVAIARLVAECLDECAATAREYQLMLDYKTVTGLPTVNANRETLKNILLQLVHKLISITAPGGRVRVETQLKGHELRISVSSSGPALHHEEINNMFIGFVQGKHPEETYSHRLSMYLCRNNVERLGGKIWAESEEGRGTVISFTLPIA